MPPKKREEKRWVMTLVQFRDGTIQWAPAGDHFGVRIAYGWSDGSITWTDE